MSRAVIIVVGGGHAGLHAVANIRYRLGDHFPSRYRIIIVGQRGAHLRKVMLFRGAVRPVPLHVPYSQILGPDVEFVQATVTGLSSGSRLIHLTTPEGGRTALRYDRLVLALGSVVKGVPPEFGGIALTGPEEVARIRQRMEANVEAAFTETDAGQSPEAAERCGGGGRRVRHRDGG